MPESARTLTELLIENQVLKSEQVLREEQTKGIQGVRDEVGLVKTDVSGVKAQMEKLQTDVTALRNDLTAGQGNIQTALDKVVSTVGELKAQLGDLSTETHEVKTETADGITLVKKVRMYATVAGDLKKPITWVWMVICTIFYNAGKAWLTAHGFTFVKLFSSH